MSLDSLQIKTEYRSFRDNIVQDFYVPILRESILYKRAVGFFSSSALSEIARGIVVFIKNGGTIQLVASPFLSDDDIKAINEGYARRNEIIKAALFRNLTVPKDYYETERLNLLSNLIADGILDIKIAIAKDNNKLCMYHEKMGIFFDSVGNKIAFYGSMNESVTAFYSNFEAIDVACTWHSSEQYDKVLTKENAFNRIWINNEAGIESIDFPDLKKEIIDRYKKSNSNYQIDEEDSSQYQLTEEILRHGNFPIQPTDVTLRDYQIQAISNWAKVGYRGIFDMATGTGKTITGLGAVCHLSATLDNKLAVIIVCPYQHLVEQWVEDIEKFGINPIIGYSTSQQKDWLHRLDNAIFDQNLKVKNREFFCLVCTNATFATSKVQNLLSNICGKILLLIDEAHNFGAESLSRLLTQKYSFRLALSATIDRHNDEEGTTRLYNFFGDKCIEYPLERAIKEKKLTRYKYYPIITTLNDAELSIYSNLSYEISKCYTKGKDGKCRLNEKGKILALKRARLVAGTADKLIKLSTAITKYRNDKHILVYCGATNILRIDQENSDTSEDDLRQIDAVTNLLGNSFNMKVSQFTSREDITERARLNKEFVKGDNLQALIAIKCLDEGVNIPAIKTAFILASTTNPKEYIQRRGRVLRLFEGKDYAVIYDFLTLPHPINEVPSLTDEQLKLVLTLVKNELTRAEEFARISMNMAEAEQVINEIKNTYSIDDFKIELEEEYYA